MAEERLQEIKESRLKKRQAFIDDGVDPYPAEARRTHTTAEFLGNFDKLESETTPVILVGRVMALRKHGGVTFVDLADAYGTVQLQITKDKVPKEMFSRLEAVDVGDFMQGAGRAVVTERGVKTVLVEQWHILTKSIRPLPSKWHGLKDAEKRYRRRELDLLLSEEARLPIIIKGEVIDWMRRYLKEAGFLEVETPVLQPQAGGAAAEPFVTHHNALDVDLFLRIAPELYLKRLLVGGLERVFEIGKNFRNEGIDREHNPEFTACEFYWAYADYEDLMNLTEKMITKLINDINGSGKVRYGNSTISFDSSWKRMSFVETLGEKYGVDVLEDTDPSTYVEIFAKKNMAVPKVQTYAKLVEELYKEEIRPTLMQPTILYDYPKELAPLAKAKAQNKKIAEAMQLVIAGTEIVWAYSELNDPVEQRNNFTEQQKDRAQGDKEAVEVDEEYLHAMEYGMPPAAGWGMGIDRLAAILSGAASIRDTITFPLLRPRNK